MNIKENLIHCSALSQSTIWNMKLYVLNFRANRSVLTSFPSTLQIRLNHVLTLSTFLYGFQYALSLMAFFLSWGAPCSLPTLHMLVPVSPVISYSSFESTLLFFFFGCTTQLAGSQFPDQGLNPGPGSESSES